MSRAADQFKPSLSDLFQKPIAFHRCFAHIAGSASGGLFLSQLLYWSDVMTRKFPEKDGWFWKDADDWHDETALTRREQESARKQLKKLGILEEVRKGIPAKLMFRLNKEKLDKALETALFEIPRIRAERLAKKEEKKRKRDVQNQSTAHAESQFATSDKQECQIVQTGTPDVTNRYARCDEHTENKEESTFRESKSVNNARAREIFSLDQIMVELKTMHLPEKENWYAQRKAQEYINRFPESESVADACRYVTNAIEHAWSLEGKNQ